MEETWRLKPILNFATYQLVDFATIHCTIWTKNPGVPSTWPRKCAQVGASSNGTLRTDGRSCGRWHFDQIARKVEEKPGKLWEKMVKGGCWDIPAFIVGCYGFYVDVQCLIFTFDVLCGGDCGTILPKTFIQCFHQLVAGGITVPLFNVFLSCQKIPTGAGWLVHPQFESSQIIIGSYYI